MRLIVRNENKFRFVKYATLYTSAMFLVHGSTHKQDFISAVEAKKQLSVEKIEAAKAHVRKEIFELKEKLKLSRETIEKFKTMVHEAEASPEKVKHKKDGGAGSMKLPKGIPAVAP